MNTMTSIQNPFSTVEKQTAAHLSFGTQTTDEMMSSSDVEHHDTEIRPLNESCGPLNNLHTDQDETDSVTTASVQSSLDQIEKSKIPQQIFVINESRSSPAIGVHQRLKISEILVETYKAKLKSTEEMADCLDKCLKDAQRCAEDVLADRQDLLDTIHEMEEEEKKSVSQNTLMKVTMAFSLMFYMMGGSPFLMMCSVGLFLTSDIINFLV